MRTTPSEPRDGPDPTSLISRHDVKIALTRLRQRAGLTVRAVTKATGASHGRVSGHFGGAHLPSRADLVIYLRLFGIQDPATVESWCGAVDRLRRGGETPADPFTKSGPTQPDPARPGIAGVGVTYRTPVSTRPPELPPELRVRGRDALLGQLDRLASHPDGPRVVVLHGLGGVGKSTLALAYAHRRIAPGTRVWWVSAADPPTLVTSLRALAIQLGLDPATLRAGSSPDLLWTRLSALTTPWVLVIDDADDPPGLLALPGRRVVDGTGWLRPVTGTPGLLVVTTRDGTRQTWDEPAPAWLRLVKVDGLGPVDGGAVLHDLAGAPAGDQAQAAALAEQLGGLPLALRQAGRYLAESARIPEPFRDRRVPRTCAAYAAALRRGRPLALLDAGTPAGRPARDHLGSTWEPSLDLLTQRGHPLARPLLRLLSCFAPAPLPFRLLDPATMARSPLFTGLDGYALWQAIQALAELGLVEIRRPGRASDDYLAVPPLVREASRHHPEVSDHLAAHLSLVTSLVNRAVTDLDPSHPGAWPAWCAIAGQCESPLHLIREYRIPTSAVPDGVLTAAIRASRYLRASGQLTRAGAALEQTMKLGRRLLADDHPDLLALRHDAARIWYGLGRLHEAGRGFHSVHLARSEALGVTHPDTLTTAHYLARTLRDLGRLAPAARLFHTTLDARRRELGSQDRATLTSRNNLADLRRAQGQLQLAGDELTEVYGSRCRLLGPEHPATLVTSHHLARLAYDRGDLRAAAKAMDALHATCQRVLGEHHPRTLTVAHSLAEVYYDQHRHHHAGALAEAVLAARSSSLGEAHPATLHSRHRLALLRRELGERETADAELQQVLTTRRHVLGNHHPDTVRARRDLDALRRPTSRAGKAGEPAGR